MSILRRLVLAAALFAGLAPVFAQGAAPPPVPALPDVDRVTSYSISSSTCTCAVGFALYGDSTDYQNWLTVYVNGVAKAYNDATYGWTITSPTGPLSTIPRPITDAVLTFNNSISAGVQIVGARRPRRVSQFSENRGVAARDLNQALSDVVAQNRETWDLWERAITFEPGFTPNPLPLAAARAGQYLCFDATGQPTTCSNTGSSGGIAAGNGISFAGNNPTTISTNIVGGTGIGVAQNGAALQVSMANMAANTAKCNPTGSSASPQDCTVTQLASLGIAPAFVNTFTSGHTISPTDCGGMVQMGTGSTGQLTVALPSITGFTGTCPITIFNGDTYTPNTSTGKILSGFPANAYYILYPLQSLQIVISNGAWTVTRMAGRWLQPGPNLFVSNAGSDTANDCLSAASPCLHIATAVQHLYQSVDNQNGSPTITIACGTYAESVNIEGPIGATSVFFITGASSSTHCVDWRPATNFVLQIGDLAVVEIQNVWIECSGCSGAPFGIFMHQHSIIDILTGVEFGTFGTGTMISCDSYGKINMPQSLAISAGAGFFLDLGPLCYASWGNPGSAIILSNTPTFTNLVRLNGNAVVTMAGLNWTLGTGIAAGQQWSSTGSSYIDQTGVSWPTGSTAGSPVAGTSPYGGVAK